jgi:hypothetical protein
MVIFYIKSNRREPTGLPPLLNRARAAARQRAAIDDLTLAVLATLREEGFSLEKNQR